jgi:hypothetical protein
MVRSVELFRHCSCKTPDIIAFCSPRARLIEISGGAFSPSFAFQTKRTLPISLKPAVTSPCQFTPTATLRET